MKRGITKEPGLLRIALAPLRPHPLKKKRGVSEGTPLGLPAQGRRPYEPRSFVKKTG
jgi:hypothetical protein